jgi:hypothetical protein
MVIPKVHRRGTSVGWLLRYLFNPRPGGEHDYPRIVAAWAYATIGDLDELMPPCKPNGRYDVQTLVFHLECVLRAARILYHPPAKLVWHCSVHNHPGDPVLSDQQWEHIATEIMHAVGLARHGDIDAVRWIAIRHADSHVHIVATLARQDGRNVWAWRDYRNTQAACRELEKHYGLHQVGPAPTNRSPKATEFHKANRQDHDEVPRDRLRQQVRIAATAATGVQDFAHRLHAAGLRVRLRTNGTGPDHATGYSVALPGHHTATGEDIWYSGGNLATDLSLPKLRRFWSVDQPALCPPVEEKTDDA